MQPSQFASSTIGNPPPPRRGIPYSPYCSEQWPVQWAFRTIPQKLAILGTHLSLFPALPYALDQTMPCNVCHSKNVETQKPQFGSTDLRAPARQMEVVFYCAVSGGKRTSGNQPNCCFFVFGRVGSLYATPRMLKPRNLSLAPLTCALPPVRWKLSFTVPCQEGSVLREISQTVAFLSLAELDRCMPLQEC